MMNINKHFAAVAIFSLAAFDINPALATEQIETLEATAFKGNWTESFQTTTPLGMAIHTPTAVKFGFITTGKELKMGKGTNFNGHIFTEELNLSVDSSREEFLAALIAANIYKK